MTTAAASFREPLAALALGGGLAGAAFALELARHGRPVAVLERTRDPHHKVCGEFLSEEAQALLGYLGVDVQALGATSITQFRFAKGARQAIAPLPFTGAGLSRWRLDEALLAAAERAGALVVRGERVTRIEAGRAAIDIRTERRSWRATTVALATGKHELHGLGRPHGTMVGFKMHLKTETDARELASLVQLVFFRGGYAGACLIEEGVVSMAWVMQADLVRQVGSSWAAQSEHLGRQSVRISRLLAGARPLFAKPVAVAAIPYGFLRRPIIAPNVYPVGDQLAVVPSFTGDGMAIALYSAVAAARAVLAGCSARDYQHRLLAELRGQFRLANGLGRLLEIPLAASMMVRAAGVLPSVVARLAKATRLTQAQTILRDVAFCARER
jgi:flavin-dependent dehydrogenase